MQNSQIPITIAVPDNSISASPNEPRPRSSNLLVAYLFVTAILSIFAVVLPFFVFPAFGEVFRAFGADLPDLTRFLMASGPYWGLAPFLSAIVAFDVWRRKECASRYRTIVSGLLAGFIIVAMAILPICVWGMYLPIFRLASVV